MSGGFSPHMPENRKLYGDVMVSTGILRYDKRGGLTDPV